MQKNIKLCINLVISITTACSFYSCTGIPSYSTASAGQEYTYMPKPVYKDTTAAATYISGALNYGSMYQYDDKNASGELSLQRSYTGKHVNIAFGGHGFFGSYKVTNLHTLDGRKNYHGYGLRGSLNLNIPFTYTDWRLIGIHGAYTQEMGAYSRFKQEAATQSRILDIHPKHYTSLVGFQTELVRKKREINWGVSIGYSMLLSETQTCLFFAGFIEHKKINLSMYVSGNNDFGSTVFRLGYRL